MTKKTSIRMNRLTDDSDLLSAGEFNFSDGATLNVVVPSEGKGKASKTIQFREGFNGNHTDPTYTKPVEGWSVRAGELTRAK